MMAKKLKKGDSKNAKKAKNFKKNDQYKKWKSKGNKRKKERGEEKTDKNGKNLDEEEMVLVKQDYINGDKKDLMNDYNMDDFNDDEDGHDHDEELRQLLTETRKKKSKSGGFQSMGFTHGVLKGILKKGYKVPTPIQRKTIPLILEGKDVVAMARTGSGKTAAFLLPMFEKLKIHSAQTGARALILSPTRELAIQTHRFAKELGRFNDLKMALILGGDSMEKQFAALHENPDIIIATPGRFLHVMVEMNLKLSTIEYVVFDEADRLFEMGFQEQLKEILSRLPEHRQTLLFSATLPQLIVDFTKAGLSDPALVRLDTETKLSENLRNVFLSCREDDKITLLLYLIKNIIMYDEMTVVFVPTRHHVEYLRELFSRARIDCVYLYSSLDQEARKDNIFQFRAKRVKVLIVTDVAARGVDIPMLDNVINLNFPSKPKLFVHRVGRVARAGRSGTAYSFIAPDEAAFVHTLHQFLNRPLIFSQPDMPPNEDGIFGSVPQSIIDEETENLLQWHSVNDDLNSMKQVCMNAYKQYCKSRPAPESDSVKKMKELVSQSLSVHPLFKNMIDTRSEVKRDDMIKSIHQYKPHTTIFETIKTKNSAAFEIMQQKRKFHDKMVNKGKNLGESNGIVSGQQDDEKYKDNEFYLNYQSNSHFTEKGLELEKPFSAQLANAVFDLGGDDNETSRAAKNTMKWDRKKKKFIGPDDTKKKKIKTESGNWISASYKSDLYKKWKERSKADVDKDSDEEVNEEVERRNKSMDMRRNISDKKKRIPKRELKTNDEIFKQREKVEKKVKFQRWRQSEKAKKRNEKQKQKK